MTCTSDADIMTHPKLSDGIGIGGGVSPCLYKFRGRLVLRNLNMNTSNLSY